MLLGAKTWKESDIDFANPINLVPAAGVVIGNTSLVLSTPAQGPSPKRW